MRHTEVSFRSTARTGPPSVRISQTCGDVERNAKGSQPPSPHSSFSSGLHLAKCSATLGPTLSASFFPPRRLLCRRIPRVRGATRRSALGPRVGREVRTRPPASPVRQDQLCSLPL
uniref:Uncharacterized protein n=1 Tax=Human betaherpesvirus 6A TaxID=32603 RepID=A0A2L2QAU7_9BETA|nr:hypothetical protein [Human betaherpesvirus 6A]AVI08041.1 hypothetical protein [Human betaherpesvirus 6A]AVI08050.1 hypothetical protein [Human betaherpesvirus 6A]AVI08167.1 hypothetical protein [Human betaherpesvirus 6A]